MSKHVRYMDQWIQSDLSHTTSCYYCLDLTLCYLNIVTFLHRDRDRETERDREKQRETGRETDRQRDRHRGREREFFNWINFIAWTLLGWLTVREMNVNHLSLSHTHKHSSAQAMCHFLVCDLELTVLFCFAFWQCNFYSLTVQKFKLGLNSIGDTKQEEIRTEK